MRNDEKWKEALRVVEFKKNRGVEQGCQTGFRVIRQDRSILGHRMWMFRCVDEPALRDVICFYERLYEII